MFDDGTPFVWCPYSADREHYSPGTFPNHRVVAPLICFFSAMWHRPDRVLRQFGMDQPVPTYDQPVGEVISNLEVTQRGWHRSDVVARFAGYRELWSSRLDHIASGPWLQSEDRESYHFHDEINQWYHDITRRTVSRRGAVDQSLVRTLCHNYYN
ncbi:Serine/threonine-protein phosphatase 7 long form homolog [Linum perenne]